MSENLSEKTNPNTLRKRRVLAVILMLLSLIFLFSVYLDGKENIFQPFIIILFILQAIASYAAAYFSVNNQTLSENNNLTGKEVVLAVILIMGFTALTFPLTILLTYAFQL